MSDVLIGNKLGTVKVKLANGEKADADLMVRFVQKVGNAVRYEAAVVLEQSAGETKPKKGKK